MRTTMPRRGGWFAVEQTEMTEMNEIIRMNFIPMMWRKGAKE